MPAWRTGPRSGGAERGGGDGYRGHMMVGEEDGLGMLVRFFVFRCIQMEQESNCKMKNKCEY